MPQNIDHEEIRAAVETALSQVQGALQTLAESQPDVEPQTKGLLDSIRVALAPNDPRSSLVNTLKEANYYLEASKNLVAVLDGKA